MVRFRGPATLVVIRARVWTVYHHASFLLIRRRHRARSRYLDDRSIPATRSRPVQGRGGPVEHGRTAGRGNSPGSRGGARPVIVVVAPGGCIDAFCGTSPRPRLDRECSPSTDRECSPATDALPAAALLLPMCNIQIALLWKESVLRGRVRVWRSDQAAPRAVRHVGAAPGRLNGPKREPPRSRAPGPAGASSRPAASTSGASAWTRWQCRSRSYDPTRTTASSSRARARPPRATASSTILRRCRSRRLPLG